MSSIVPQHPKPMKIKG